MSELIEITARGAKPRQIEHIAGVLVRGGLIAYPTDSGYALGWRSGNRAARDRVIRLRELSRQHHFTYCCRSLSDVGNLARLGNAAHRLIRQLTPGPYTFVLPASSRVPRMARANKQHTIGVRIPDHPFVQALLEVMDEPLLSSSLLLPDPQGEIVDSQDLYDEVYGQVDLFVDAGYCPLEPTTLLDLTGERPVVLRRGAGMIDFL
ncbi:MAG: threonylcarbamoyl-AMP synthase [Xanthomonadales bacterium]|nr:threonylcarbamoyl-AMP synthase [Xanthomonadales bacterium]NIN60774.1 threonylcarbamoyl-AMP synthase [Xanthomonadales bacterium]NIN76136.1 threonylcarbamoyl-AMP synthase [Xanthomonadales bacterium]NIO15357.1 threonylcarbamoyl-AMP synthase [Xanthomonadales bacterium]NIP13167.1 threonylcarbamoyl-AMP synthase [Xanthomonadales bacterium]